MTTPSVLGILSYKVFPAQMGGQKGIVQFYEHLSQHTRVVLAVARENTETGTHPPGTYPFLFHHRHGFANLLRVFRLRKLIRQEKIEIICIEHSYLGWLGVLLRWLTHKPFVIHSHNIETHRFRDMNKTLWWLYQPYEKWVHRKADHSFFVTENDRQWALRHFRLEEKKCSVLTFGIEREMPVSEQERLDCRRQLLSENGLPAETRLFLFNGTLDYLPNTDALRIILTELLGLLQGMDFAFRIIVCGSKLSGKWQKVLAQHPDILYKGFVHDIGLYCKGADCLINPVTLGGGIKTKLLEALSFNQPCVSTESGARGIPHEVTGERLAVVADYDWPAFAHRMRQQAFSRYTQIPPAFYQMFNWETIVRRALLSLQTL